jgi:hypothetical protein
MSWRTIHLIVLFSMVIESLGCTPVTPNVSQTSRPMVTLSATSPVAPTFGAPLATPRSSPTPTVALVPPRRIQPTRTPTARRTIVPTRTPPPTLASTPHVEIRRNATTSALLVNGRATYVKGMNYNVNYTALDEDVQWKLHRRDFQIMRNAGINMIVGWGIYDEITLQVAQEFGIGVIMPFDLDPEGAYENEGYREQLKAEFREYVQRYRNFPAVWGWNPGGDELLYRMRTEENRTPDKLQAASDLELELALIAHTLDPNHIVLIKEPRDWYLKYMYTSFQSAQVNLSDPSKFILYGVNVYGKLDDVEMVLRNTKKSLDEGLGIAMIVSEFAPFLLPRAERAQNYAALWEIALRISGIGGCVYVFGPDQPNPQAPNPYDPLVLLPSEFSLVDIHGTPLDDTLATLQAKWRALGTPTPMPPPTATRVR